MTVHYGARARDGDERRHLTPQEFAALGLDHIAYLKPVQDEDGAAVAIHAADGTPIGMTDDIDVARAAVLQHDLEPVSVH